jgi:hypothetical protein
VYLLEAAGTKTLAFCYFYFLFNGWYWLSRFSPTAGVRLMFCNNNACFVMASVALSGRQCRRGSSPQKPPQSVNCHRAL